MLASLIQTHVVEPASRILDATATIASSLRDIPLAGSHLQSSELVGALQNKACIRTITEIELKPQINRLRTPLYRVHPGDLYHLIRADPNANAPTPSPASSPMSADQVTQLQLWLERTRPDMELVMEDMSTGALDRILSVEIKRRDVFTAEAIRDFLIDMSQAFMDRHAHQQMESNGHFRLQQYFRDEFLYGKSQPIFTAAGRYITQCIAQEWKYMAGRGQTWGIVTNGWDSVILEIDWSQGEGLGDVVYSYTLDSDSLVIRQSDGSNLVLYIQEIVALLARANVVEGLKDNDLFVRLCEQRYESNESYVPSPPLPAHRSRSQSRRGGTSNAAATGGAPSQAAGQAATDDASLVPSALPNDPDTPPDLSRSQVAASLVWTSDARLKRLILRTTKEFRPKLRFAFSPAQRLEAIIRARAAFQADPDSYESISEDLRIILEAATVDHFTNLVQRRKRMQHCRQPRLASRSSRDGHRSNAIRQGQLMVLSPKLQPAPGVSKRRRRSFVSSPDANRIKTVFRTSRKRLRSH